MSQKRRVWVIVVLVLAVLAFVGISTIPLLRSVVESNQPSAVSTPNAQPSLSTEQQDQLEEQAKGYELVLQREPQNQTALRGLLEAKLRLGDVEGAIAPLETLAELNPDQPEYGVLLAQAKEQTGDREGAAQAYRQILASQPGDINALKGLAALYIQQNRPEAAIGLLQETIKNAGQQNQTQPGRVDVSSVKLLLGEVYLSQQRFTETLTIYDELIEENPQDFRPVLAKALILRQQGKTEEAKPLFTTAVSLAPQEYKDQVKQLATLSEQPTPAPTASPDNNETPDFPEPLPEGDENP
ncbi:tetratricopeptide repeat domain protein [Coleofasciculus chthonoplastes PCC 7420]|uniref:Tetratricopeptide repeat domain protein n=1 Tax=Coleofasciculus chthonoplastes PCC 7420 TaxID=118168 RepID=B4VZS1_9CYAN|nr:tetratricopeptide repeat protein [Coleofasciculus chthonoplastes]EDX72629.1 tetratricopeptide repeat domain protein [Coleofasciculus chthonoplastes PCC 7420]